MFVNNKLEIVILGLELKKNKFLKIFLKAY